MTARKKGCPLTVWRCVHESRPCMECRLHRVRAWAAKKLFGKQYKCPKYKPNLLQTAARDVVLYMNVNADPAGEPIYERIGTIGEIEEIELTPEERFYRATGISTDRLHDALEKVTQALKDVLDDAVQEIIKALQGPGGSLHDLLQELMNALDPPKQKDRARREKGHRLAKERQARRRRPMTAPPGGHIWIRHERRTRHMARGEVE